MKYNIYYRNSVVSDGELVCATNDATKAKTAWKALELMLPLLVHHKNDHQEIFMENCDGCIVHDSMINDDIRYFVKRLHLKRKSFEGRTSAIRNGWPE